MGVSVDNEMANEFWEYKLPQGVQRPRESSSASETWRFIQRKYEKKEFVPKNVIDPAKEFKESGNKKKTPKKKPATPPTDDDSVTSKQNTKVRGKKPAEKVDIKDLLDIDVSEQEKPKVISKEEAIPVSEMPWDIFTLNTPAQPIQPVQPAKVVNKWTNPQVNKYAALDQMIYPAQFNSFNWNTYKPAPSYPTNCSFDEGVKKEVDSKVDTQFADILPNDFI
jgi:hypothetical protein